MAGGNKPGPVGQNPVRGGNTQGGGTTPLTRPAGPGPVNPANSASLARPPAPPAVQGWPSQLEWSQFNTVASPSDGGTEQAQIATSIPPIASITVEHHGNTVSLGPFTLKLEVDKSNCWVVRGQTSAALLRHEQVHWDIAGLNAHEVSRALKALRESNTAALGTQVQTTMANLAIKAQAMQFWYDDESKHGLDARGQKTWEDKVAAAIANQNAALPNPPEKFLKQARDAAQNP